MAMFNAVSQSSLIEAIFRTYAEFLKNIPLFKSQSSLIEAIFRTEKPFSCRWAISVVSILSNRGNLSDYKQVKIKIDSHISLNPL